MKHINTVHISGKHAMPFQVGNQKLKIQKPAKGLPKYEKAYQCM